MYVVLDDALPRQPADRGLAGDRPDPQVGAGHRGGRGRVRARVRAGPCSSCAGSPDARLARELDAAVASDRWRDARRDDRVRDAARRLAAAGSDRAAAGVGAMLRPARPPLPAGGRRGRASRRVAAMPTWSPRPTMGELGLDRMVPPAARRASIRADRSRSLTGERGGRLDRLDLWFLVVLVLATMTLRTFRLAEPYQMHFDEVYHARTATEFLQAWRYGLSHDIYEWTHPHLAKYAMALGLVLWGEDDVKATSDLGVPVVARRRAAPGRPGRPRRPRRRAAAHRDRRRDPHRTTSGRAPLISTIPAPGVSALAIEPRRIQLVVGYDDGRVATLDLDAIGPGGVDRRRRAGRPGHRRPGRWTSCS